MNTTESPMQEESEHGQQTKLASSRILIVDDEVGNVRLLEEILGSAGFPMCRSTTKPVEISDICADFQPDLILSDLHMPNMDGIAVMEQLSKTLPLRRRLPVMILTADASPEARERAFAKGAADFMVKPFNPAEVVRRVRRVLALHQTERKR